MKTRYHTMTKRSVFLFLIVSLLLATSLACGFGAGGPTPTPTPVPPTVPFTPPPTSTATPVPPTATSTSRPTVIQIEAPEAVLNLWNEWNGKYVFYAHVGAGITEFGDLDGMTLLVAWINSDQIFDDANDFVSAGNIEMTIGLQNNADFYGVQLLEDESRIGIMVPDIAEYYGFEEEETLVQIEFK